MAIIQALLAGVMVLISVGCLIALAIDRRGQD
jgi:hypothetical protein